MKPPAGAVRGTTWYVLEGRVFEAPYSMLGHCPDHGLQRIIREIITKDHVTQQYSCWCTYFVR